MSADRSGMAASRFFIAAATCVVLLRFAAASCESDCNGTVKVGKGALAEVLFGFGSDDFPFKIPSKECFKILVFSLWRRAFGAANRCNVWSHRL